MSDTLPSYYSRLEPFRKAFETGNPVLTYHKLGPRPRGVRLKGLYVSERLFRRQLSELKAAGFSSGGLEDCIRKDPERRVVITFDDGYSSVVRYGAAPLREYGFRAVLFVVADYIGLTNEWDSKAGEVREGLMDLSQLREWVGAGHEIGSHTRTHPFLTRLSVKQATEEISGSKKRLEDLLGIPVRHFCFPYGDCNRAVMDQAQAAGYQTACTTIAGINLPGDQPFGIKRFTARYESRNLKAIWRRITSRSEWK